MSANIAPSLTAWAAAGFAMVMMVATGFHVHRRERSGAPVILPVPDLCERLLETTFQIGGTLQVRGGCSR